MSDKYPAPFVPNGVGPDQYAPTGENTDQGPTPIGTTSNTWPQNTYYAPYPQPHCPTCRCGFAHYGPGYPYYTPYDPYFRPWNQPWITCTTNR